MAYRFLFIILHLNIFINSTYELYQFMKMVLIIKPFRRLVIFSISIEFGPLRLVSLNANECHSELKNLILWVVSLTAVYLIISKAEK